MKKLKDNYVYNIEIRLEIHWDMHLLKSRGASGCIDSIKRI